MSWIDKLPKRVDDGTSIEFAVLEYGRKYIELGTEDLFE